MKTMAKQCEERGVNVASMLGKTASQARAMGFDVPPNVPGRAVLQRDTPERSYVATTNFSRSGLLWVIPDPTPWEQVEHLGGVEPKVLN